MPKTHETTVYTQRLIIEFNRARKVLRKYFKARHEPIDARRKIQETIENTTRRQSKIIGGTLIASFHAGIIEGTKIAEGTLTADAMGFDLSKVSDTHINKITKETIGHIGQYNEALSKQLILEYDTLLADNRLVTSLKTDGWTPWLDKSLEARGVSPEVISLAKGQTTTAKMIHILEMQGIRGGKHPREVAKTMLPHIQRYFGPSGVTIDNRGKFKRVLEVKPNGNFSWVKREVKKVYKATPKTYANLLARSSMIDAHHSGRFLSLEKSNLVDYYISHSILGPRTCARCAMMHGQRVSHAEGPLYHPMCMCDLKPFWKKDTGLKNKDPDLYEKESNQHFWNQHQLKEFNKTMPRGKKLKYSSLLPKDALKAMPDKEAMYEIRKAILK